MGFKCLTEDCNGHGNCTFFPQGNYSMCVCDDAWTGKSDILTYEGFACNNNKLSIQITYAIVGILVLIVTVKHIKALKYQLTLYKKQKERAAAKGKTLHIWQFSPVVIIMISIALNIIPLAGISYLKIVNVDNYGGPVLVTVFFAMAGVGTFIANTLNEVRVFEALSKGSGLSPKDAAELLRFMKVRMWTALGIYAAAVWTTLIVALSTPDDTDPEESPVRFLLVLRNLSFVAFLYTLAAVAKQVRSFVEKLIKSMSTQKSEDSAKAQAALQFVENSVKDKLKAATVSAVVYAIFCLPFLWHLQVYAIALFIILGMASKTHPINTLMNAGQANKTAVADASSASSAASSAN